MMQRWEALLEAARLKVSAPEAIYDYLSKLQRPDVCSQNLPDEIVDTLIAMNHPLVDIGLARFASNYNKIEALWDRGVAVRLALLSNQNAGGVTPEVDDEKIIAHGSQEELDALLSNPSLAPFRLARVISNKFGVDEARWQIATRFALCNHRLTHTLSNETWTEFKNAMEHVEPINEAWRLYETVEPTEAWAEVLQLMGRLNFDVALLKTYLPDLSTDEGNAEWNNTKSRRA